MEKYFALIKNNLIESVIVASDDFVQTIKGDWDHVVDVTNTVRPSVGDSYYSDTGAFVSNSVDVNHIPADLSAKHLKEGTQEGFEPFQLSKYSVKYEDGMVVIGCKRYSLAGFIDSLHKFVIEKQKTSKHFTTLNGNPCHGKFDITWEDMQKLYDVLIKVKI